MNPNHQMKMIIKLASTSAELQGILTLQKKNLKDNLTNEEFNKEGFVTLKHDIDTLKLMSSYANQIIAVDEGEVIGYALVMARQLRDKIPILKPMWVKLDELAFGNVKISNSKFYIMGQICIDIAYRGHGIFAKLYNMHKVEFRSDNDYCITEVSADNLRSLNAHEKVGFVNIHSFSDKTDTWNILLLDLKN